LKLLSFIRNKISNTVYTLEAARLGPQNLAHARTPSRSNAIQVVEEKLTPLSMSADGHPCMSVRICQV